MEIRKVKIEEYWPLIVRGTEEFGQIAVAENPEFNRLAESVYGCLKESFILPGEEEHATEYGVSRWEKMLGLAVTPDMTLDDRKAAILTYMSIKLPYTWRVLKQMLTELLGEGNFEITLNNNTQELAITYRTLVSETPTEVVEQLVSRVVPVNLLVKYDYDVEAPMKILEKRLTDMLGEETFRLWRRDELNKLFVMTNLTNDDLNEQVLAIASKCVLEGVSVEVYNTMKYAHCVTFRDIINTNAEYYWDLTSNGEWIYELPELTSAWQMWQGQPQLKAWLVDAPKLTNLGDFWAYSGGLEYIEFDFSNVESMGRNFTGCPLKTIPNGFNPKTRNFDYLFAGANLGYDGMVEFNEVVNEAVSGYKMLAIWGGEGQKFQLDQRYTFEHLVNGNSCFAANGGTIGGYYGEIRLNLLSLEDATAMFHASTDIYHFESPLPKLRTAKDMFRYDWAGRAFSLDKTSALCICQGIPKWEDGELHELTIGIYEGYKTDQEVLDALALAEEKGWTLTIQWGKVAPPEWTQAQGNTQTPMPLSMQTIYAKIGEMEYPDGIVRPTLDWGHYITNWEENGYMEFDSVEEARGYFGLPPVEEEFNMETEQ